MKDEFEGLNLDSLRECFELVSAPPNEDLIRRYVGEERGRDTNRRLSVREREWIEVNLRCNPSWQKAYRLASARVAVKWPRSLLQIAAAVATLLLAPLWTASLNVSSIPSQEALRAVLEFDREVVRGSHSEPIQVPRSEVAVLPPTLGFLVDVNPLRSDTALVSVLKQDLIKQFDSSRDEFVRARAALGLTKLSLILKDEKGVELWKSRCEAQGVIDCR